MAGQINPQVRATAIVPGSPYCSDPACVYCEELRKAQEQLKSGKGIPRRLAP